MKRHPWRATTLLMGLLLLSSAAEAAQAPVLADALIKQAAPTLNAGAAASLDLAGGATALIRFDLSAVPGGLPSTQVLKATAFLWVNSVRTAGALEVFAVGEPWVERTVTFATGPYLVPGAIARVPVVRAGQYLPIDLTSEVKFWVDYPGSNDGIAVTPALDAGATAIGLDSKENTTTSHPALLEITLAAGGAGLNWKGTWSAANAYTTDDAVYFQGSSYRAVSAIAANGAAPSKTRTTPWTLVASMGATGPAGARGATGPQGEQGEQGPQGDTGAEGPQGIPGAVGAAGATGAVGAVGATGPAGLNWRGAWVKANAYRVNDAVYFQGSSYRAVAAIEANGAQPSATATTPWTLVAARGETGATGGVGPQGTKGDTGAVGAQGLPGAVGATGPAGPQGATGVAGPQGPKGGAGVAGPQGLTGPTGAVGRDGAPGASGTAGSKGDKGDTGAVGPQGLPGPVGATGPAGPSGTNFIQFELYDRNLTTYVCHEINLLDYCGDQDGCTIRLLLQHETDGNDKVFTIEEQIYMEQPSLSNNQGAGLSGHTRQTDDNDWWITGTSARHTIFHPWDLVWMRNYRHDDCAGQNGNSPAFSDPYLFSFMSHPNVRANIIVYDR